MMKKALITVLAVAAFAGAAFAVTTSFSDVPSDHWAADSISWNAEMGIMSGPGDMPGMFDPAGAVNRAQLATVNQRMYEKLMAKMEEMEAKMEMMEEEAEDAMMEEGDGMMEEGDGMMEEGDGMMEEGDPVL